MRHKEAAGGSNIFVGRRGEEIAEEYLKAKGVKVIERNFRTHFGEIDLVCRSGGAFIFVEVKTRISMSFGPPHLSITRQKKRKIIQNAQCYLKRFGIYDAAARLDVISINLDTDGKFKKLEHIKNAIWIET
jgi:putative endonuclease